MEQMKKLLALLMVTILLIASLAACGGGDTDDDVLQVGIIQSMEHPAMTAAQEGFRQALADEGFDNIEFDYQNAQGDISVLPTIATRFVSNEVDLVLAIGTPSVQAIANATEDIPIVGTAITSYERAGVVQSNEAPGWNVTGASDMNPVEAQLDLIPLFVPHVQTIGIIYSSDEANAVYQAEIASRAIEAMGLNVDEVAITTVADVQQAAISLADRVDAIYLPTCNVIASAMAVLGQVAIDSQTPMFAGEENMTMIGGLATLSINYFDLGYQSGLMAATVLRGDDVPANMPIRFGESYNYIVNGFMAEQLGIAVPQQFHPYIWWE